MSASWSDRWSGRVCYDCGARRNIIVIWQWHPPTHNPGHSWPGRWLQRARCFDAMACRARVDKARERIRTRASRIWIERPAAPDAPLGTCRWCGEPLTGRNGSRRNYCYSEREGRDCLTAWHRSYTYDPRVAVRRRDCAEQGCVRCVDCHVVCEPANEMEAGVPWDADHEVPLEDGGEHVLENLRCRCVPCHKAKTVAEAKARAAARLGLL